MKVTNPWHRVGLIIAIHVGVLVVAGVVAAVTTETPHQSRWLGGVIGTLGLFSMIGTITWDRLGPTSKYRGVLVIVIGLLALSSLRVAAAGRSGLEVTRDGSEGRKHERVSRVSGKGH